MKPLEENEYLLGPVNHEKTMFIKWAGDSFIFHSVCVNDFATFPTRARTSQKLKDEFERLYSADFEDIYGLKSSFLEYI